MPAKTSSRINPKSVTILAMGPTTMQYINRIGPQFERPTKHVWAINNAGMWFHDIDLIIAMDDFKRDSKTHPKYVKALTERGVPVLTCTAYKQYPSLEEYPLRSVLDYLGLGPLGWHPLDNSCNYALAYAMYKGMKKINLFGFSFVPPLSRQQLKEAEKVAHDKYGPDVPDWFKYYMKPAMRKTGEPGESACAFLLGKCHEKDIEVSVAQGSTILNMDLPRFFYGYQNPPDILKPEDARVVIDYADRVLRELGVDNI